MVDYDLSGLSSRSFEKLVQAVAGKTLGAGTVTFGDGPDGGREAIFDGRMDYPSRNDPWDGYCVVQAKFLQRPKGASADSKWVLQQLEAELKAFIDPKKKRKKPQYYIIATNAILTPPAQSGGKDKATSLFTRYRRKLGLRDWAIWDFDEICKFLDQFSDIRTAYACWITAGDVLSEVMAQLAGKKPNFLEIMSNFLAKELRSDQFANLEQAGHNVEDKIPLARVFVDLPVSAERTMDPPVEDPRKPTVTDLAAFITEKAKDRLDPSSISGDELASEARPLLRASLQPGRYVLLGGPGQGKTTVGQFLCQLFRVALLRDRPIHLLAAEIRDTISATRVLPLPSSCTRASCGRMCSP